MLISYHPVLGRPKNASQPSLLEAKGTQASSREACKEAILLELR